MFEKDKLRIIQRYNKRIEKKGENIQGLASGSEDRRNIQFQILSEIGNLNNKSILDLGCGFGDFFNYLNNNGIKVKYTGIDINEKIINVAKERITAEFICGDILELDLPKYDYILSASTFNNEWKSINNYELINLIFNKCYELSNIAFSIDFLTKYVDYEVNDEIFYYQPERIFSIAKTISKRVVLRHDYPLYQFCIYIYKDFKGWKK